MIRVKDMLPVARSRLVLIGDDKQLTEAASLLADATPHMVVVCDGAGTMLGVITRTDIVRQIRHCHGRACTTACTVVMSKDVVCCHADDWLHEVWARMKSMGLQSVPIIDAERRPIGLVSARDAMERLLTEVEHEEEFLRDYVSDTGSSSPIHDTTENSRPFSRCGRGTSRRSPRRTNSRSTVPPLVGIVRLVQQDRS